MAGPALPRGQAFLAPDARMDDSEQEQLPPQITAFAGIGDCMTFHAPDLMTGRVGQSIDGSRISITIILPPQAPGGLGIALTYTPSPDHARAVASTLMSLADEMDADAQVAARQAIARARQGRPQ
ncbi:MAG: hypothetical protein QHC65_04115 [Sphingomonas sp.]|nr:hypothetical protein [Sphingomonas sp.]MDX3883583.1 hypothetical protein [Sphingomonas sp.]